MQAQSIVVTTMKLLVPVSYFFGSPRSEIWQLDTTNNGKKLLTTLLNTERDVRGKGITGLSWLDDVHLVACDFNRILKLDRQTWTTIQTVADDEFNDLHHLTTCQNQIYLANTGRDCIDVLDEKLCLIRRIDGLKKNEWQQRKNGEYKVDGPYFDAPGSDLSFHCRRGPDKWHFNHVFKAQGFLENRILATSFGVKAIIDAVSLEVVSSNLPRQPHDGFVHGEHLWVTTVSGQIYRAPLKLPLTFEQVFDLFASAPHQGWCRGLYLSGNKLFAGITAIYEKSKRTNWLKGGIENTRSGIYEVDLASRQIEAFHDFTTEDGSRIFSFVPDR